ncbi:MAG: hybrid sensor histidine kinase/response regulator [Salibacteraceae bacterium]
METTRNKEDNKILYVDDRVNNLNSFKALFRREYQVFIAESPEIGMQILAKEKIKVVLSDYKMPGTSGVIFLEAVKNQYPETIRIMLTGHADLLAVVEAINKSEIFRFLAKPWSEEELKNAIEASLSLYDHGSLLNVRNQELSKAYNELDKLVYSTAHDITGPLSNILGLLDLIDADKDGSEEYLSLIKSTTKKLQYIARDVLSFHRNKRTGLHIREVQIEPLIHSVLDDHKYLQDTRPINIEINVTQGYPLRTDKSRMRFILNNLISNAIKYQDTAKKENWVKISFSNDANGGVLEISDNGVGISESLLPKIFDIYYRASNKSTGAGIGLYIANEAAELVKGNVKVDSKKNVGTTFKVSIPNLTK